MRVLWFRATLLPMRLVAPWLACLLLACGGEPGSAPVNPGKKKQLTNMRASGSDDALRLTPHWQPTLEEAIELIADDEMVEVTPKSIRIRKITLDHNHRRKEAKDRGLKV